MDDKPGILGKTLGQAGNLGKQIGKGIADESKKTVQATKQQVGIEQTENKSAEELEKLGENEKKKIENIKKDETKQFVMGLYAKSGDKDKMNDQRRELMVKTAEENQEKTPEEIQKLTQLRQTLHKEYYEKLVNPPKQQEEAPAERVERLEKEEQQKRWELQKKEEKKKPVIPGPKKTAETRVGAG